MGEPDMSGVITTLLAFFGGLLVWFAISMVVVHHATGRSRPAAAPRSRDSARPRPAPQRGYERGYERAPAPRTRVRLDRAWPTIVTRERREGS